MAMLRPHDTPLAAGALVDYGGAVQRRRLERMPNATCHLKKVRSLRGCCTWVLQLVGRCSCPPANDRRPAAYGAATARAEA